MHFNFFQKKQSTQCIPETSVGFGKKEYVPASIEFTDIRIELGIMTGSAALKPKVGSISETWNDAPEQKTVSNGTHTTN